MTTPSPKQFHDTFKKILSLGSDAEALLSSVEVFEVCQHPRITIEARGHGKWAICCSSFCYAKHAGGRWYSETLPSGRTDKFIASTRFDLEECFALLEKSWVSANRLMNKSD